MFQFTLNGKDVAVEADKNLLEYLRADARMTSVKDGCAEGVCGTCSVIVNKKAVRACTLTTAKVHGKHVTTSEGISPREREVYAWAFGEVGAVQCGFCTSGMIVAAHAFLQENPKPSIEEIRQGLSGNLCRCTGYKKIVDAVCRAAGTDGVDGRRR